MQPSSARKNSSSKSWRFRLLELESSLELDETTVQCYQEVLYEAAQDCGPEHRDVAEVATHLADLFMILERYLEAEVHYRRALKIYAAALGDEHMIYSMALRNLAEALQARGKTEEAQNLRFQARGIFG